MAEKMMTQRLPAGLEDGLEKISVTEDLAIEHAMLDRIMLAMNNAIRASEGGGRLNLDVIRRGCGLIKQVVDNHHMKFEEENIYPLFKKGECADFVNELRTQHEEARRLVSRIDSLVMTGKTVGKPETERLKQDFIAFHDMIGAHAAFEASILFPILEGTLSDSDLRDLKERDEEHLEKLLGKDAEQKLYNSVRELESMAGITGVGAFTKKVS